MIRQELLRREQLAVLAALALLTVAAWGLTVSRMGDMVPMGGATPAMSHGTMAEQSAMGGMAMDDLGELELGTRLLLFLGMWVTMMAAMMLPAAAPMILLYGTISRRRRERGGAFVPTWVFVGGYLATWTAFGACAYLLGEVGDGLARASATLGALGPRAAALAMLAAGLYQLTPLKQRCLSHCRSPLDFAMHHWRPGTGGALRMGAEHGAYCVGCCWVLMVLLVTVGLASLPWMGLITLIISAEKLLPRGRLVTSAVAICLIGLGVVALARPGLIAPAMG